MEQLINKRVLVTGGNGFLGSALVEALEKKGAEVYIADKVHSSGNRMFHADITDFPVLTNIVKRTKPEIVFHLAASLNRNRDFSVHDEVMKINYYGTLNLLRAMSGSGSENFIFTSTSEVYGDNFSPFSEEQIPKPASPYSLSKYFAESTISTYCRLNGMNYTIMRLFNFFGRKMPGDFFISQLLNSLISGKDFNMTGGEQIRDYLYIDDVVDALILAAVKPEARNEIFNVSSGNGTSLKQLVIKFQEKTGSKSKINAGAIPYRENEIWNMTGNNRKIEEMLGFKVKIPIDHAIDKLIRQW